MKGYIHQSQPSSSTIPVPSPSSPPVQSPPPIPTPIPASTPIPIPETDHETLEHTFEEPSLAHQHFSPPQEHCYCEVGQEGEEAGRNSMDLQMCRRCDKVFVLLLLLEELRVAVQQGPVRARVLRPFSRRKRKGIKKLTFRNQYPTSRALSTRMTKAKATSRFNYFKDKLLLKVHDTFEDNDEIMKYYRYAKRYMRNTTKNMLYKCNGFSSERNDSIDLHSPMNCMNMVSQRTGLIKIEDRLYKQIRLFQHSRSRCKPKSFYDEKHKVAIGYKNPLCLTRAKQTQSALYNGRVLVPTNHTPTVIHDSEDTREIARITRKEKLFENAKPSMCGK
ncbi:hypothetical protein Tco_0007015 [Tanacetum coccineum]